MCLRGAEKSHYLLTQSDWEDTEYLLEQKDSAVRLVGVEPTTTRSLVSHLYLIGLQAQSTLLPVIS